MKKIFVFLLSLLALAPTIMADSPKKGILMVHYGTTNDDMRHRALETINSDIKTAFPDAVFMEAYTSPMVIKSLQKRGLNYLTPLEALMALRAKGVKDVVIQSTMLMNGSQTEGIGLDAERMRPFFDNIVVGKPLLNTIGDSQFIIKYLKEKYPQKSKGEAVVFVGHGGDNAGTAIYSQLANMFDQESGNYYVTTIEGYPEISELTARLKKDKIKKLKLVPLLIVGGNHIYQDIDGDLKNQLRSAGYAVEADTTALGEDPAFRTRIVETIRSLQ